VLSWFDFAPTKKILLEYANANNRASQTKFSQDLLNPNEGASIMKTLSHVTWLVAAFGLLFCGCEKSPSPIGNPLSEQNGQSVPTRASALKTAETIPSPLVTVNVGGSALEFWPFTGVDFSGTPQDPINLIFAGQTDPRALRAALLFLDGIEPLSVFPMHFPLT
jgi:hypothetical protein